jgi:5-methylcytosine-specific restriction protein B
MGMFWIRPDTWISTDGKNVGYSQHLGCLVAKPKTATGYPDWLQAMKKLAAGDATKFSLDAHLWSLGIVAPQKDIRYWLIAPGERARLMQSCIEEEIISLGWGELTDMNGYKDRSEIEGILHKSNPSVNPRQSASMIWQFAHEIAIGDYIFAKKGTTELVGWGVVTGKYFYNPDGDEYFHTRLVEWRSLKIVPSEKQLPNKTLTEKTDDEEFRALVDKHYLIQTPPDSDYTIEHALTEIFMERPQLETILRRLRDKKNIILQGAPGVGKTFIARRLAHLMIGTRDDSSIEMVQFHPSYSYEDFVQGIKPCPDTGKFIVKDGIFHRFCERAASDKDKPYFLIIDEINRGNLGKILGELMMLIETDKRGQKLTLTYSGEPFSVPPNLHLIGTMNTADRSLSMVDYALRRRFSFITLHPGFETDSFRNHLMAQGITPIQIEHLKNLMAHLNREIEEDTVNLGTGYRIGHSFFTPIRRVEDFDLWSRDIIAHEILPLLEEYWMDELETVENHKRKLLPHEA